MDATPHESPLTMQELAAAIGRDLPPAWPAPLDLEALARTPPAPPEMIIDDWLPAGYATLIAGHGGLGKSGIALHLAACIATGKHFFGLAVQPRKVIYLSCEDRESVLHWRLTRICEYRDIPMPSLAGRLDVLDLVGHDTLLWHQAGAPPPAAYSALRSAIDGHEVIFVDGISDVYGGNENARAEVKAFVNATLALIPPHGAVVLLGHVNRQTAGGNGGEGYSGSTGWHNSVRARWYLSPEAGDEGERTGDLILELQKSNLGQSGQQMRLTWHPEAHLHVGELIGTASRIDRDATDRAEQAGILAALREVIASGDYCPAAATGPRTAWHVLSARKAFPEGLNSRRLMRHIERLRAMGAIHEDCIRRSDRKTTVTLVPADTENIASAANAPMRESGIGSTMAAGRLAANAAIGRGVRGDTPHTPHTPQTCPKCDGEGCRYCRPGGPGA